MIVSCAAVTSAVTNTGIKVVLMMTVRLLKLGSGLLVLMVWLLLLLLVMVLLLMLG